MSRDQNDKGTHQPDNHDRESRQERAHERAPDDPGRGQGDVLDEKVSQEPADEPSGRNRR